MLLGQYLISSKFDHWVDELSNVFREDLPDLATWRPEITRWRMKFHDGFEHIPIPLQKSPSYAHEDVYTNIRRIFIILLTLPVTSVYSHLFVDSKHGKELQWAKKSCVVWPCSMFTEIRM